MILTKFNVIDTEDNLGLQFIETFLKFSSKDLHNDLQIMRIINPLTSDGNEKVTHT